MKIVFSRWVGVDGVVLAPDHLDRQNADCGAASRFYRRGVAFRFQNWRAPSRSPYGASRRCRPGLDHQSLALSMIRPAPPTSAVVNFSSAAQVSLKSTVRISAGQNRSWRGTLTSASAMRSVMERFLPIKLCIRQSRDRDGKFDFTARPPICNPIISIHRPTGREASENFFCIAISHACWWLLLLIDGKKIMPQPGRAKFLSVKSNQTESLRPDSPTGRPRREVIFPRRFSSETASYDVGIIPKPLKT